MNCIYYSGLWHLDRTIVDALAAGAACHGDHIVSVPLATYEHPDAESDVAIVVGVANKSKPCMEGYLAAGKHVIYMDKGYIRYREQVGQPAKQLDSYFRMSVDSFQPVKYFQKNRPSDRADKFHFELSQRRYGTKVLYAGKSQKFCDWFGLGNATAHAEESIKNIRKHTGRDITYRVKKLAAPLSVTGIIVSDPEKEKIYDEFKDTWCLVTQSSNAALDAIIYGVPAISIGECISNPVTSRDYSDIEDPYFPSDEQRWQWLCDMSYCQFQLHELSNGFAWGTLKEELRGSN